MSATTDFIAEAITEAFGERCPDYVEGCAACDAWKQYDDLRTNGWMPIKSAPRDRPILTCRGTGIIAVAEYAPSHGSDWCIADGMHIVNVTHWQPLPKPPVSAP